MISLETLFTAYEIGRTRTFHGRFDEKVTFPTLPETLAFVVGSLEACVLQYNLIQLSDFKKYQQ